MNRLLKQAAAAALTAVLLASLCLSASAAWFPDAEDHWAREAIYEAVEQGWLNGFEDGTMRPDEPVTGAQAAVLLCRILDATYVEPQSDEWYAAARANGLAMGFLDSWDKLDAPLSRLRALRMLCEAFQLYRPKADTSILDAYSDTYGLTANERSALAGLVDAGFAQGSGGELMLTSKLTRAEFCTLLQRVMKNSAVSSGETVDGWSGERLWIGAKPGAVTLRNVKADTVIVRTQGLESLTIEDCEIGTLILAQKGDVTVPANAADTIRVGTCTGTVNVGEEPSEEDEPGRFTALEVTGSWRTVDCRAVPAEVRVTGSHSEVRLRYGADRVWVGGESDRLFSGGEVGGLEILGKDAVISGEGTYDSVTLRAPGATLPEEQANVTENIDYGLRDTTVELIHPSILPVGNALRVEAVVHGAPAITCRATWIAGGVSESAFVDLGEQQSFVRVEVFTYTADMATVKDYTFRLDYTTPYGEAQTVEAKISQQLENHDPSYYDDQIARQVIAKITDVYSGDYTLEWALEHDYSPEEKEIFVNHMGYSSETSYLVWISKSVQRVNIFTGSRGSWKLIRTCIVGTGAPSSPTPSGVFKVTGRQEGWYTNNYTVKPVVRFKGGGYAFHSRLYWPGTEKLKDASIGFPVSHGCVRMYDEDVQWIYDYIPTNTTVVSY